MRKLVLGLVVCLTMMTMALDANAAKRFGGGANIGRSAPTFTQKAPVSTPQSAPTPMSAPAATPRPQQQQQPQSAPTQAPRPQPAASGWLSKIGMALGLAGLFGVLGSLFGHGSFGLILLLVVIGAIYFMLKSRAAARPAPANAGVEDAREVPSSTASPSPMSSTYSSTSTSTPEPTPQPGFTPMGGMPRQGSVMDQFMNGTSTAAAASDGSVEDITPADFDKEGFLKVALENYRKLQLAWDTGNVTQISDFTTDDVFIAITHQLRERGNVTYHSEVLELKNELQGITQEGNVYLAGVRFTGKIKIDGEVETIDEVWTLEKKVEGLSGWQLAGIKQLEGATP